MGGCLGLPALSLSLSLSLSLPLSFSLSLFITFCKPGEILIPLYILYTIHVVAPSLLTLHLLFDTPCRETHLA